MKTLLVTKQVFGNMDTWDWARNFCEQMCTHCRLAVFETMEEFVSVKDAINDIYGVDLWIGAIWEDLLNGYQWVYDGLSPSIEDAMWSSGVAPNGTTGNGVYFKSDVSALWVTQTNVLRGFICEYNF